MRKPKLAMLFILALTLASCASNTTEPQDLQDVTPATGTYLYAREALPLEFNVPGGVLGAYSGRLIITGVKGSGFNVDLLGQWEVHLYGTLTRDDGSEYVGHQQTLADGSKEWRLSPKASFPSIISHKCRWPTPTNPECDTFGRHAWVNQVGNLVSRDFRFTLVRE